MGKSVPLWFTLAIAAALVIAGCGSGGDSSSPLTKAEFLKQGDGICKEAIAKVSNELEKVDASGESTAGTSIPGGTELISSVFAPAVTTMAEELGALVPPQGDAKEVRAIIVAFEKGVREAEANPEAALGKSTFTGGGELAGAYGLKTCASF